MDTNHLHDDTIAPLRLAQRAQQHRSFTQNLRALHDGLARRHPEVACVAVALFDTKTGELSAYAHSGGIAPAPYSARLADLPALAGAAQNRAAHCIADLHGEQTSLFLALYPIAPGRPRSCRVQPLLDGEDLIGFVFFASPQPGGFGGKLGEQLDQFAQLVATIVAAELAALRSLIGAIHLARSMAHLRDVETGTHLDRMARYARLIAQRVAPLHARDEEFVEHVFLFAPLHDIGKVGIPDSILLKRGRFDADERRIMQSHVEKGMELIATLIDDLRLRALHNVDVLRNIVAGHHERLDGSGYPRGLSGEQLALEARITAVADVFDALTGPRPYKRTWSNDEAFAELQRDAAAGRLDAQCVAALWESQREVEAIQRRFRI
ncbi:MAG: HD domain-containing protein [Rhodocyclaceae bacterium]|nr:HD domain-containing protein [Rhodocyclaceae bacterium]MBX3668582.1 HD domain-containing protein [Rhodocyclaceae bacterium]